MAVRLASSLAQLHSLITHPLIGQDVDKAFKQLNPCCINMQYAHSLCINSQPEVEHLYLLCLAFQSGCLGFS